MVALLDTCTIEEQHSVIYFLSSEGVKPNVIHWRMKTQYRDACLSLQMYGWDRKFKNGVSSVADADRSGWPHTAYTTEIVEHAEWVIQENCCVTTDEVALELGISHGCAHSIMHDVLQYCKVCARWVTRQLTPELKERHRNSCKELLGHYQPEVDAYLQNIVTGGESWDHSSQPEQRQWAKSDVIWTHWKTKDFVHNLQQIKSRCHCSGTVRCQFWSTTWVREPRSPVRHIVTC
jgi:hypothetical protein